MYELCQFSGEPCCPARHAHTVLNFREHTAFNRPSGSQTPTDQINRLPRTSTGVEDNQTYRDVAQIREGDTERDVDNDDRAW